MTTKIKFTSPFGVAKYPHLSAPDTKGKYADDKWKTKLVLPLGSPEAQAAIEAIKAAAVELQGAKGLKMYMPFVEDEEANELTIITKTTYAPAIFDGKGNPAKGVQIGGGSVLRVMGNIVPFEKGVTLQLNQVQIKELNGFGSCGFDSVEDGYEYSPEDAAPAAIENDGAGASDNTGAGNGSALDI